MAEDEDSCQGLDEQLSACISAEEIKCMGLIEKRELAQVLRLSREPSCSPRLEKAAKPQPTPASEVEELQQRLQNTGMSSPHTVVSDDPDEVMVLKEVEKTPRRLTLRRPPIRSMPDEKRQMKPDEKRQMEPDETHQIDSEEKCQIGKDENIQIANISPLKEMSPSNDVRARKKEMLEPANKQTATPVLPEVYEPEMMPVNEYVKLKAEIYALNVFDCVDTALSTLAENSSIRKRKKKSLPFFYSAHALSLKLEDYVELCCRKFGFPKPPSTCVDAEETFEDEKESPKNVETTSVFDDHLEFSLVEESTSKYNLRQRTGNKRTASDFDFTSDGEDSDSIIPNKKNRDQEDTTFSPREEAKVPIPKTRVSKLSLATAKIAAQQTMKPINELSIVDSDESNDSDVPGKEVCVPKLQYSAAVGKDTAKWKTSKGNVSAKPKDLADSMEAMAKARQVRAKPEVIKPGPVNGKTRRAALAEGSNAQKRGRGKQATKKESEKDLIEESSEEEADAVACPVCNKDFPKDQIQAHVNACCDESASQSTEGQCPVCNKHFPQHELQNHSSSCIAMEED